MTWHQCEADGCMVQIADWKRMCCVCRSGGSARGLDLPLFELPTREELYLREHRRLEPDQWTPEEVSAAPLPSRSAPADPWGWWSWRLWGSWALAVGLSALMGASAAYLGLHQTVVVVVRVLVGLTTTFLVVMAWTWLVHRATQGGLLDRVLALPIRAAAWAVRGAAALLRRLTRSG